jgi:TrmH family RNA methyltransferase
VRESFTLPHLAKHGTGGTRLRRICRGQEEGLTVIDGPKLVVELAEAGVEILELYITEERLARLAGVAALAPVLTPERAFVLAPELADRMAPTQSSQGVLAVVRVPVHTLGPCGIVVYLDRIQDPGNVGAVIRCAAAFGATGVACSPGCGSPFSARAIRASAGHSLRLPVVADADFIALARGFSAAGGQVVGADAHDAVPLAEWSPQMPCLLVLGHEGTGLAEEIIARTHTRVHIPLANHVESLNVAVACGVIMARIGGVASSPILESRSIRRW